MGKSLQEGGTNADTYEMKEGDIVDESELAASSSKSDEARTAMNKSVKAMYPFMTWTSESWWRKTGLASE